MTIDPATQTKTAHTHNHDADDGCGCGHDHGHDHHGHAHHHHHAGQQPIRVHKVGRNDPCPCGSQKKYKKCCLSEAQA